jgi:hypothetical protein
MDGWTDWWVKPTYAFFLKRTQCKDTRDLKFGKALNTKGVLNRVLKPFPKLPVNISSKGVQFRYFK